MTENYVISSNNHQISFSEIYRQTPASVYASETHDEVCHYLAQEIMQGQDITTIQLYTNLLLLKSKKTRQLSALVYLINNDALDVKSIHCSFVDSTFFSKFISKPIVFVTKNENENLLDNKYKYFTLPAKMLIHGIYRILKNPIKYKPNLIKTYVEDTIGFYPKQLKESTIMIYPFNLNVKRQQKFIQYCKKNHDDDYTLMGLPYAPFKYLLCLLRLKASDKCIIETEHNAYLNHAKELLEHGVKNLYTLDEYETASFVMHTYLMKNDVHVVNKTHGVGGYCLFLNYSELHVYTSKQFMRYSKWNPHIKVLFQDLGTTLQHPSSSQDQKINIVFIHGNMEACGLFYEEALEYNMITACKAICDKLQVDFSIKFHPNTLEKDKDKYRKEHISIVEDITDIHHPLFITIFSTAYYDFLKYGPFLFFSDNLLNPKDIFGNDIEYTEYQNCEEKIEYFTDFSNYLQLHNEQIEYLKNR